MAASTYIMISKTFSTAFTQLAIGLWTLARRVIDLHPVKPLVQALAIDTAK